MSNLFCCITRRQPSPDLPSVRYNSYPRVNSRALLPRSRLPESTGTVDSTKSEDRHEISRIFASSQDPTNQTSSSGHTPSYSTSTNTRRRLRSSTSRLQDVLKKRLSRDSIYSSKSAKRKSKQSLSDEDIERRKELKRALHQRLRDELLRDSAASQGGYDTDAKLINTPKASKSRSGGAIQISPKSLSDLVRKLEPSHSASDDLDFSAPPKIAPDPNGGKPVGYHREANISKVTSVWEDDLPESEAPADAVTEIRQILGSPPIKKIQIVQHATDSNSASFRIPLDRSITVIHAPFTQSPSGKRSSKHNATEYENPASPDLLPLRMPSMTDSVRSNWRLSLAAVSGEETVPSATCMTPGRPYASTSRRVDRPSVPENWRREALTLLDPFDQWKGLQSGMSGDSARNNRQPHQCDPDTEEQDFGGVDGENGCGKRFEAVVPSHAKPVLGDAGFNTDMEAHTAPKTLYSAISLPQLPKFAPHSRSRSSGNYSTTFSIEGRRGRYSSSSEYGIPVSNRPMTSDNASSVYTFQGESYRSSPRSSIVRLTRNMERLNQHPDYLEAVRIYMGNSSDTSSPNLIPESHGEAHVRRRTIDTTSFQSSTDSFRARELAATARIVPKSRTLTKPKVSRFKEDLECDDLRSKSLGRKSMLGKGLGKKGNFRSYDGGGDWYSTGKRQGYGFAFVPNEDESAAALWERALKEHAAEAAASTKRPGSLSQKFGSRSLGGKRGIYKGKSKAATSPDPRSSSAINHDSIPILNVLANPSQISVVSVIGAKIQDPSMPKTSIPPSWAKYPSYNRPERTLSAAGKSDQVDSRDFATTTASGSPISKTSAIGKRKKSRSMTFGKGVLKSWSRLYKSYSSYDVKHQARGFRSSISYGKSSEYPELEVFGVGFPVDLTSPYPKMDKFPCEEMISDDLKLGEEEPEPIGQRSARAWSKLYEECVEYPVDTDIEDSSIKILKAPHVIIESGAPMISQRHHREPSSNSVPDIRGSTKDFHRSLRVNEVKAKKTALEAAEKAWAA